ncbi:DNRLRE domain-containing protein [Streptomyces sp. NPDC006207]
MTSKWGRVPGRRAVAAAVVTAVAACGLTYAGLSGAGNEHGDAGAHRPAAAAPLSEAAAVGRAARTGKPVEATGLRTAYETTWALPDGTMRRRVHATPVRAEVDGHWRPIDTTLARTRDGWAPRATNVRMTFSAGARKPGKRSDRGSAGVRRVPLLAPAVGQPPAGNALVTLDTGGHQIVLTWPDAVPTPIIDGSRALYPEILPGADLVLTAEDGGFGQVLVVKNRQAAADPRVAQLSYGLSSPDLSFALDPVTGIVSADDPAGEEVALSPTPLMWDSAGTPALTDGQAGSTAAPTAAESLSSDGTGAPDDTESPSDASPEPSDSVADDDNGDTFHEVLPDATDEAADPSATEGAGPDPTVPPEALPEPTHSGGAATLDLPSLSGPQPDSHGTLVGTDLNGTTWTLTPDQEFLADPDTVYPVFVDPSVSKHTNDWTTAYSRHPNANFYNGRNFNKGTHEARVGFESDTWGTSRSFFSIDWNPDLKGATVISAKLRLLETYAWSCSARTMNVYLTGPISNKTTWKNAPSMTSGNKLGNRSFSHGYRSSCPDDWEAFDVKPAAQKAVAGGWSTLTIGLRAGDEGSAYSWKKFQADGDFSPYVELVYNRPPAAPSRLDLDPELSCDTTSPYINVGASSITFWASSSDKDGNLASVTFELWPTGGSGNLLGSKAKVSAGSQTSSARVHTDPFSTSGLKNGTTYSWRAKSLDKQGTTSAYTPTSTPCRFVFDSARPTPPTVTSTQYPDADASDDGFKNGVEDSKWSTVKFGTAGAFTFKAAQTDVVKFEYGFNSASYTGSVTRTNGAPTSTLTTWSGAKPPLAGPNVLYVRAVDGAGNASDPRKYFFYVTPRDEADKAGDFTGDGFPDLMVVDANGNLRLYPSKGNPADLTKGTGMLGYSMSGAYRENPAKDPNGGDDDVPLYIAPPSGYWKNTQITHLGDVYGGDGLQDLVAIKDGKLWVYPGDGYGAVNIDKRREILLPSNAPAPNTITQIVSAGDATGDGKPDFFLTVGDAIWAFVGYNGATVDQAVRLSSSPWTERDIVTVQDVTGDGVTDLVYRTDVSARLLLRTGIKDPATGGVKLDSLAAAVNSEGGVDTEYGASGWSSSSIRVFYGTPDANGDAIPDIWTLRVDGTVRFYAGSRTALSGAGTVVITNTDGVGWKTKMTMG